MDMNEKGYLRYQKDYKKVHYTSLRPGVLDYVHTRTIEMLRVVIPILHDNNIRYFLCGGSLRGAYLQKGILPWDEDIDLCVIDEDYDRMEASLLENLPPWMVFQCKQSEPKYYHGWAKIRDMESHVFPDEPLYQCNGVLIDLYKMKLMDENAIEYELAKEHYDYLNRRLSVGGITRTEYQKRVLHNRLKERMNAEEKRQKTGIMKYVIMENHRVIMKPDECFPRRIISFEGMDIYSFNSVECYLQRHYGKDYSSYPDEKLMLTEMCDVIYNGG